MWGGLRTLTLGTITIFCYQLFYSTPTQLLKILLQQYCFHSVGNSTEYVERVKVDIAMCHCVC
jgi:hypothetical protein